ncbi:MAG: inositol monophosphatase family protein [Candidatus Woesearchaeota archaeon]
MDEKTEQDKDLKQFAMDLAREAGRFVMENYGKIKTEEKKRDNSFVTNVDKETEKLIVSRIREAYPDHAIIAEEGDNKDADSEYKWIIDPIDGTRNFIHEIPLFSVSIGLVRDDKPFIGAVYFPATDELFHAEKGKGAFLNDKGISVSGKWMDEAFISYGANLQKGTEWHMKVLPKLISDSSRVRVLGCATINMCSIAAGRADAYIARYGKVWDFAASLIIVEEAGGKVTGLDGKPYTLETEDFIASNGRFHDELVRIASDD